MALQYRLPDGITFDARGEADSDWNGFPVPILGPEEYSALVTHIIWTTETVEPMPYRAEYVDDGKVTAGYYCDGLQWEKVYEPTSCIDCARMTTWSLCPACKARAAAERAAEAGEPPPAPVEAQAALF